ncbi:TSUP family transporter [Iamia sp. SCSIO 61187]|uniref:sulfite exporter TauE/SafE family protein n=1 Tax=Iamia sp. SCSIO 61187 TaxID=2722752 RepID=UPI001C635132|nr:sulfite exporter TauE/SafE family protein [Iamia sp. SCSIO 61187]QYG92672.1 TSUP family transporter [Iamia sp. SCSIO 61187]
MTASTVLAVLAVGAATGFLGGLFGKGGSALATPVLAALGIPAIVAVASPLPATIPGTLLAARQYARAGHVDRRVLAWSAAVGLPATLAGAAMTRWIAAESLVVATDLLVAGLGMSILVGAGRGAARRAGSGPSAAELAGPPSALGSETTTAAAPGAVDGLAGAAGGVALLAPVADDPPAGGVGAIVGVAVVVGVVAGLLANSGGFLLAPLLLVVLRLPVRPALGTSLAVSAALALPGTVAHAALGHVDWGLVGVFGAASVPLAAVGARTALRIDPHRLEVVFGAVLVLAATVLLAWA